MEGSLEDSEAGLRSTEIDRLFEDGGTSSADSALIYDGDVQTDMPSPVFTLPSAPIDAGSSTRSSPVPTTGLAAVQSEASSRRSNLRLLVAPFLLPFAGAGAAAATVGVVSSVNGRTGDVTGLAEQTSLDTTNSNVAANTAAIDGKQASDPDLATIAALDATIPGAMATDGAGWVRKTYAQMKTALGLVKADVGLDSVDNTADAAKPVSTAGQAALDAKVAATTLGVANGVATLDAAGKITATQALVTSIDGAQGAVSLSGTYVPKKLAHVTEDVSIPIFEVTPVTAGSPAFQALFNSFPNTDSVGTRNHGAHIGFNAGHHNNGPVTAGKAAIYMGFEDNYFDSGGDNFYGVEWYIGYISPDGTTTPPGSLRPFYCRVRSDNNTASAATIFMEIGTDGSGSWQVRTTVAAPIINVNPTGIGFYKELTMIGASSIITAPMFVGNSTAKQNIAFRAGAASGQFVVSNAAATANNFTISDAGAIALRDGAVIQNFGTGFKVGGAAGHLLGFWGKTPVARPVGWAAATGTSTRTTFDTRTVTTAQLAERVKALIDNLTTIGLIGA